MGISILRLVSLLKSGFFTGVLVLIPLGVIAWLLWSILEMLWKLHELLPESVRPENIFQDQTLGTFFNIVMTAGTGLLLAFGISLLGWASKNYFGRKILDMLGFIINRIPVIRSVYSALDQLLKTLAAGDGKQFNRVVYIEYPRKGIWTLAFVTGPAKGPAPIGTSGQHLNVYVPTTPNPTSGFHLIVSENDVRDSNMRVEEAFKTILSLGIAQPTPSSGAPDGG